MKIESRLLDPIVDSRRHGNPEERILNACDS